MAKLIVLDQVFAVPFVLSEFLKNGGPDITSVGPGLAVNPNNPNHIVEANSNPVTLNCEYRVSFDGGLTWTHLTGLPPFRMADVKYSPVSSQRVVATTYADTRTGNRGGIWRSLNGGVSHSPKELTSWEDCARGANVLLHAVLGLEHHVDGAAIVHEVAKAGIQALLDEGVLRFLVVVNEGAQPVPVTAGKSDEEDDE